LCATLLLFFLSIPGQAAETIIQDFNTNGSEGKIKQTPGSAVGDTITGSSLRFAGFPVAGYSPETRIIGGVTAQFLWGIPGNTRPSSLAASLLLSQNRQYSVNFFPEIWWKNDRYRIGGEIKWQHWPDVFYGIGNDTREESQENYTANVSGIKLDGMKSLTGDLYAGLLLEIENNRIVEYDTGRHAILPLGTIPGSDHSVISGIGIGLAWDSRKDILLPSSGGFYQFRVVWFNQAMGSTHPHAKWILDLRKYGSMGRDHLLRFQIYGKFINGKEVPFRNMAQLGGDKLLRGYFKGRYRDHNMILAQAEYQSPPIWRIRFAAFAGIGDVFHSVSTLDRFRPKPSAGIGFRYKIFRDRRINARLDLAAGKKDQGIYLGILEAF
jgi:outer membrane protein assembly factor BamA